MNIATIVQDIHRLNHVLERFELTYGIMSDTFYEVYNSGEEPEDDAWVLDFEKWAGLYEVWRDRKQAYKEALQQTRQRQPSLSKLVRLPVGV